MADEQATYLWDDREFQALVSGCLSRLGNLQPAHEIAGEIGLAAILRNFEEGGRPDPWPDLAESTKDRRQKQGTWPGQILVRSGVRGGLMGSIFYEPAPDKVVFYGNKPYARIQHFGGRAGKGHKARIPSRKYMVIPDADLREIQRAVQQFIFEV